MATSGGLQPGGGNVSFPDFTGSGSPEGAQVGAIGQVYEDTDTGNLYAKVADDGMDTGWQGPFFFSDTGDRAASDVPVVVVCDGTAQDLALITATPPTWLDGDGMIAVPGLYSLYAEVVAGDAPTTPGLYGAVNQSEGQATFALDPLPLLAGVSVTSTLAIGADDLPFDPGGNAKGETDITATLQVSLAVQRLGFYVP